MELVHFAQTALPILQWWRRVEVLAGPAEAHGVRPLEDRVVVVPGVGAADSGVLVDAEGTYPVGALHLPCALNPLSHNGKVPVHEVGDAPELGLLQRVRDNRGDKVAEPVVPSMRHHGLRPCGDAVHHELGKGRPAPRYNGLPHHVVGRVHLRVKVPHVLSGEPVIKVQEALHREPSLCESLHLFPPHDPVVEVRTTPRRGAQAPPLLGLHLPLAAGLRGAAGGA
mmetsp:Transcript_53473/g.152385  ORF Transcript_53473/g.152385 Transcript_53473/m.152385 type:complete len:225 (-) Transcript_53473:987-1661(-)